MKKVILFYSLFISLLCIGQNLPATAIVSESNYIKLYDNSRDNIEGTRYLNKHWNASASVYSKEGKVYQLANVNFDLDKQSFYVELSKDTIFKVDNNKVKTIEFNNATFERRDNAFYEVVSKGEITLLKKYSLEIVKGVVNSITKEKVIPDRMKPASNYFVNRADGTLEKVRLKKKDLIKLFADDKQANMKTYVKKNKLSYKKEKDVKKILKYYNSLE